MVALLTTPVWSQTTRPVYQGEELKQLMKRVMDFQVRAYGARASIEWQAAPFWDGVLAAHRSTGDEEFYQAAKKWGEATKWKIGRRSFHADDTAIGQAYEEMYLREKNPEMIADLQAKLAQYFDKTTVTSAEVAHGPAEAPWRGRNVWWWCDALFMAPPTLVRMGAITGDKRYFQLMHSMYWDTTEFLFDPAEGLFYRDESYFVDKKKSPTGKKVFWGRGNGWVYGGLIRTLDFLPADDPQRSRYIDLYKKMTEATVKYQGDDGLWRASLNEPTWISQPESSSTGFFTFGLLAGINRGYLDRATYLPKALHGWRGICSVMRDDGGVGYAQQVGAAPEAFTENSTKE
jgi:rhamnogalacturonyl hydrolase YesR